MQNHPSHTAVLHAVSAIQSSHWMHTCMYRSWSSKP